MKKILVAIAVLLISALLFLYLRPTKDIGGKKADVFVQSSDVGASTSASIDNTQDLFKVYENKNFGISFEHPSDWKTAKLTGNGTDLLSTIFLEGNGQRMSFIKNFEKAPATGINTKYEEHKTNQGHVVYVWEDYQDDKLIRIDARISSCESLAVFVDGMPIVNDKEKVVQIIKTIKCF